MRVLWWADHDNAWAVSHFTLDTDRSRHRKFINLLFPALYNFLPFHKFSGLYFANKMANITLIDHLCCRIQSFHGAAIIVFTTNTRRLMRTQSTSIVASSLPTVAGSCARSIPMSRQLEAKWISLMSWPIQLWRSKRSKFCINLVLIKHRPDGAQNSALIS